MKSTRHSHRIVPITRSHTAFCLRAREIPRRSAVARSLGFDLALQILELVENPDELSAEGCYLVFDARRYLWIGHAIEDREIQVLAQTVVQYLRRQAVDTAHHLARPVDAVCKHTVDSQGPLATV